MSFGQVFFVIGTILAFSAVGFYLGSKFGPRVLQWSEVQSAQAAFLPDDQLMTEVKKKLAETSIDYNFFEVVQNKKNQTVYALHEQKIPVVKIEAAKAVPALPPEEPLALADDLSVPPVVAADEKKPDKTDAKTVEKPADKPVDKAVEKIADKTPEKIAEKPVEKPVEKPASAKVVAVNAADAKKLAAEKPAPKTPPTDPEKTAEIRAEVAQTKYLLQTGSYESQKKAEKAKLVWSKRGYQAQIVVAQAGGKQWYRLRLGLYDDYDTIQNHQKNIRSKYNETAMILPIQ